MTKKFSALSLLCIAAPALATPWTIPVRPEKAMAGQATKPAAHVARRVMVAGNGDMDACLSTSFVRNLKPGAYLSVRAGPDAKSIEIGRLQPGHAVWNCDSAGEWVGVVYRPDQRSQDEGIDCDLGPSDTARRAYRGDCRSGWVHGRYLLSLAG